MRPARLVPTPLPPLEPLLPPWPGDTVALPSGEVFLRQTPGTTGMAEPAVYVHGLGGSATNWTDLAGLLAPRLDAVAVDLPGFGHSPPPRDRNYSIAARVRSVVELIEAGEHGAVHLLGNSLGGLVSVAVAAIRPDLVRSLTLISPALPGIRLPAAADPALTLLLLPGASRLAQRRLLRQTPLQRAHDVIDLCFGNPGLVPEARLTEAAEEAARRAELPYAMEALTASLRGIAVLHLTRGARSPWRLARTIQAPTLVVWGDRDKLVHVSLAPRTARAIPDSRLLVLPGVGHTAQLEDPVSTARAVLGLLDDVASGTAAVRA